MFLTRCTVLTALLVCAAGFLTNLTASELCVVVIDEANLPLPNAWINVTRMLKPTADANNSPIKAYNSSTDAKGAACLAIPEGTYSVEVGLTGFLNVRYYPVRLMYPYGRRLNFQLPIGDVTEDGVTAEAILSGVLQADGSAIGGAKICILQTGTSAVITCGLTNVFGEYALSVPPGTYRAEIRTALGEVHQSTVSVPRAGSYRDLLSLAKKSVKKHENH